MSAPAPSPAVAERVAGMNVEQCLRVVRFSPSPRTDDQLAYINACFERMVELKAEDPAAFTEASKRLGW